MMTTPNNSNSNLSLWQPGQNGASAVGPKALEAYALARLIGDKTVTSENPDFRLWAFTCEEQRVDDLSGLKIGPSQQLSTREHFK